MAFLILICKLLVNFQAAFELVRIRTKEVPLCTMMYVKKYLCLVFVYMYTKYNIHLDSMEFLHVVTFTAVLYATLIIENKKKK